MSKPSKKNQSKSLRSLCRTSPATFLPSKIYYMHSKFKVRVVLSCGRNFILLQARSICQICDRASWHFSSSCSQDRRSIILTTKSRVFAFRGTVNSVFAKSMTRFARLARLRDNTCLITTRTQTSSLTASFSLILSIHATHSSSPIFFLRLTRNKSVLRCSSEIK